MVNISWLAHVMYVLALSSRYLFLASIWVIGCGWVVLEEEKYITTSYPHGKAIPSC